MWPIEENVRPDEDGIGNEAEIVQDFQAVSGKAIPPGFVRSR
jgi:hypothetical protein